MKTKTNLRTTLYSVKITLLSIAFTLSSFNSSAQNSSVSFEIGRDVSGNGLGGNVCPAIGFTYNKFSASVGANFQKRKMNFSGVQTNYRYFLAKNYTGKLELFIAGNLSLHTSAGLSRKHAELESYSHPEGNVDYNKLRYTVVEGYAGIGLKINPTKNISATLSSSLGVYDTLDKNYDREMYREKSAMVLQLRAALIYNLSTK